MLAPYVRAEKASLTTLQSHVNTKAAVQSNAIRDGKVQMSSEQSASRSNLVDAHDMEDQLSLTGTSGRMAGQCSEVRSTF